MPEIDGTVASILNGSQSDDEDALIASLEESPDLDAFREQRIQQLHIDFIRAKTQRDLGFGSYTELKEEKELISMTASIKYAVVHFAKDDFGRCAIMDTHLESLAAKHFDTRFLKINVNNAPFLVTKLKIRILPCVLAFVDGVSVDRLLGFDGLGTTDAPDFIITMGLEARLLSSGVIQRAKTSPDDCVQLSSVKDKADENIDDDDWD